MEQRFARGSKLLSGLRKALGCLKKMLHRIELADEVWTDVFLFLSRSNIQKYVVSTNQHFRYIIHRYLPTYPYICIYKLKLCSKFVGFDFQPAFMFNDSHKDMKYKDFWKTFGRHAPPLYFRILALEICPPSKKVKHQNYIDRIMSPEWLRKWQNSFTTSNLLRLEGYGQPIIHTIPKNFESSSLYMTEGNKYNHLLTSVLNDIALTSHISICVRFDNATMLSLLGGRTIMEMPAIQQCRCVSITCDRHDALLSFGTAEQIIDWLYSEQQSRPRMVGDHPNVTKVMSLFLRRTRHMINFAFWIETKIVQDFIDADSPTYFDLHIYGIYGENRNSAGHQTNAITKETLQISKSSSHIKIKRRPSSMFWAYNSSAGNKLVVRHEQN